MATAARFSNVSKSFDGVRTVTRLSLRLAAVVSAILGISLLHYLTGTEHRILHQVYQRLYYLPVVAASLWFGVAGGVGASVVSAVLYFPHIFHAWAMDPVYRWNQYSEILIIFLVGLITGTLSSLEKRQRAKLEAAYERLQKAFVELQKKERMTVMGQLAAGIAHEIRNPLGSIQGAFEIIESGSDAARQEFLPVIKKEIARLNNLITGFLRLARPMPLERRPADLNEVVRGLAQLLRKRAETQRVEMGLELADLPGISIDSEQIKAALMNLVLNAIESMPEGGTLRIRTRRAGEDAVVEIEDEGSGIPEEARSMLFEPFFTTKKNGTGLGLATSEQIVRSHGGTLRLARSGPEGSVFEVLLPRGGA